MKHAHHILAIVAMATALTHPASARPVRHPVTAAVVAVAPAPLPTPPQPVSRYDSAPWWSDSHVIAQTGTAFVELPANRADMSATFRGVGKTVAAAQADAVSQAQGLVAAMAKYDAKQAGVTTALEMRALYEQYRDSDGNKVDDQRGDKINGYEVSLTLSVDVRDMSLLEKIFAQLQAAAPTSATDIAFRLQPDNPTITQVSGDAIRDARNRALAAADATGAQLGAIRLVDPTGRACHSDMLAPGLPPPVLGGADYVASADVGSFPDKSVSEALQRVDDTPVVVTGMRKQLSPEESLNARALANAFVQTPPMQTLTANACIVYDLK